MTSQVIEYDPYDPDIQRNPYPAYRRLREHSPVHHVPGLNLWVVSRWADAEAAAQSPQLTATRGVSQVDPFPDGAESLPGYAHSVTTADPPVHTRWRKLLLRVMGPQALREWEPRVARIADELVANLVEKARNGSVVDLTEELAVPLPTMVVLDLFGLPRTEFERFDDWADRILALLAGVEFAGADAVASGQAASAELGAYIEGLVDGTNPVPLAPDGLLAAMRAVRDDDGEGFDQQALIGNVIALILAGLDTTTNLIANGFALLLLHPEQFEQLRADRTLLDSAIEEVLRYESPAQGTFRTALEDVEIGGTAIPAGARLQLAWGSANRDETRFENAEVFDIARKPKQLAFGIGRHFCIGAALARMEAHAVFTAFLDHAPAASLAGELSLRANLMPVLRKYEHVPVRLT